MGTLTLQKVKDLWKNGNPQMENNNIVYQRANEIFNNFNKLAELCDNETNCEWGEAKQIGRDGGGIQQVLTAYRGQTGNDAGKNNMLDCVYKICPGLDSAPLSQFAIMSSTQRNNFENKNAGGDFQGLPRSYFLSSNHPATIAKYLFRDGEVPQKWYGEDNYINRFPMKYLWMLKTPSVIPILSLQSFYNLAPVFEEVSPGFKNNFNYFNDQHPESWVQSLDDFTRKWATVSDGLYNALEINLRDKNDINNDLRKKVATFLFYVSLLDNVPADAKTMLEHGNHAIILYGPPGTGKTYRAKQIACEMLGIKFDPNQEPNFETDEQKCNGKYQVIQFHPNYTYQDFIGGIYPDTDENSQIKYIKIKGVFQQLCEEAADKNNRQRYYILIIDEINRANLSAVFGELMYCLEYRDKEIQIPLFGRFSIPKNVYIIGTMNHTDKSLIGFDLALRRRFGFIKIMPDMSVLNTLKLDRPDVLQRRAENLNKSLSVTLGLSEDKQIGHAYFMKIMDFVEYHEEQGSGLLTSYALEKLWDYHISPLLEEYLGMEFDDKKNEINGLKAKFTEDFSGDEQ